MSASPGLPARLPSPADAEPDPAEAWRARILAALAATPPAIGPTHSDDAESAAPMAAPMAARPVPAAVLVPIVLHPERPSIVLTRRTAALRAHAGQVSFPGGRIDPTDASPTEAALRESFEEIGLAPSAVELAGHLPAHLTGTGYAIAPVVGLLRPPLSLVPDPREVDALFELDLAAILDPDGPRQEEAEFRGRLRRFWVIPHEREYIWGATAAILVNLGRVLRGAG